MARIFLSHSSANNAEAVALRNWLIGEGWDDLFLDLDPKRGIVAGDRWERALNQAASRCEVILFLISKAWLASRWCLKELNLAQRLGKRLFGVVVEDIPLDDLPADLTGTWQLVWLASGRDHMMLRVTLPESGNEAHVTFSAEGLARLKAGLQKAGLDAKYFDWPPPDDSNRPPYRGLRPLEAEDAGIFFGREGPIVEALDRLRGLREAVAPRLMVILGASGAGKSSFLRAGLVPRLARDDRHFLVMPVVRPQRAVLSGDTGLVACLEAAFNARGLACTRARIRASVDGGAPTLRPLLADLLQVHCRMVLIGDAEAAGRPPILVVPIDQGEELFLAEGASEAEAFLTVLKDLLTIDSPAVAAVFTIRSDAYERLQMAKPLEGIRQDTFSLAAMPKGAYAEIIKAPARRLEGTARALTIEEPLVDALLADVEAGGKDALPLLAFTLERLYLEHGGDGDLRLSEYDELGRVRGSIEAAVERALSAADADPAIPKERAARLALLRRGLIPALANVDLATGAPRRRVARMRELPAEAAPLIGYLIEMRLLATDVARGTGEVTIEPAHEALLRQWGLLQTWLAADFQDLAALEGVKRAAHDWAENDRSQEWIAHAGGRLEEAERVAGREDFASQVEPAERAYLAACRAVAQAQRRDREAQLAARERAQRRARWATIGVFFIGLMALAAGLYQARATDRREARVLTNLANQAIIDQHYDAAMRIALQGLPAPGDLPVALGWSTPEMSGLEAKLAGAAQMSPLLHAFTDRGREIRGAAFSPDGKRIVTSSKDRTARLWDSVSGELESEFGDRDVSTAAFSPDGTRIVTGSEDGTARIWDAAGRKILGKFKGHDAKVYAATFSADASRIVTASEDKTAIVWNVASGEPACRFKGHRDEVYRAAFSPDGARIVTASRDQSARVWDAARCAELSELKGYRSVVLDAEFSPDGARIVTASDDGVARVWDATSGEMLGELTGHRSRVHSAVFSPDGRRILTASEDGTARLWDAGNGEAQRELTGHGSWVRAAVFALDGKRIVTASGDGTARVWDVASGDPLLVFAGHRQWVLSAAFSRDGARLVTASTDKTARVWDAASGALLHELKDHRDGVAGAAFSPDGTRIATASDDGTVRVWDAANGKTLRELAEHGGVINGVAFSPDGTRIATASGDKTARVWDTATGETLHKLEGHGDRVMSVAFSPDGRQIVTASFDQTARVWDATSGKTLHTLPGHTDKVMGAAFSPDGARIVTASYDRTARVWDAVSGSVLRELKGHTDALYSAAFSPDGARIVTASYDRTARVWDVASGLVLRELKGHSDGVASAEFSPDGTRVVTASGDGTARMWDVSFGTTIRREDLIRRVCAGKLRGAQMFTSSDTADPVLSAFAGTNPCRRVGPLSLQYWFDLGPAIWAAVVK
ncbi:TIR domain-containing protein [Bradyrhizobium lablabi]|uniref:nSTAND1 domain-containing NTPase n=1 Tax=Bradyrhizobium lablabi TaxID=722472 RepID=UPI001BAC2C89|nr:TIR domain-containing protein [Bradyrhizobium lablabi]MBR1125228.1 TIR domain-containing protein [Bradyrhizobium lablabi]